MAVRKVGFGGGDTKEMPTTDVEKTPAAEAHNPAASRKELGTSASAPSDAVRDGMTPKDLSFIAQASLKSTLESPMIANLSMEVGRDQVPALIREYTELGVQIVLDIMAKQK